MARDFISLVVPALAQTQGVQRHGHQHFRKRNTPVGHTHRQQGTESAGHTAITVEFERTDQAVNGVFVAPCAEHARQRNDIGCPSRRSREIRHAELA